MEIASPLGAHLPSGAVPELRLNLSDEAHDGWHAFARRHGISMAVLFEVLGRHLHDEDLMTKQGLERLVTEGRELTHERRRAGGPKPKPKDD